MYSVKKRLRQLRQELGLTMSEFSQQIHVSAGNVGDWESEKRSSTPGAKALIAIANTYNVSLDWLLLGKNVPFPAESKPTSNSTLIEELQITIEGEEDYRSPPNSVAVKQLIAVTQDLCEQDVHLLFQLALRIKELASHRTS
ncbi:helix-turn-helix domain-containing protein [Paenibacillus sp. SYP-B4298]|uniref:helix-turn-helix domain-containing protein n=1 Tax=Paenibacillus sp. SYP-B4298 TaxID=2996034 RepID=UPI0022DCE8B3|nr:helix-turn-helix transcriptional regulator [Paenibacillus sp. SYP-B4298]